MASVQSSVRIFQPFTCSRGHGSRPFVCIRILRLIKDVSRESSCIFGISNKGLVGLHDAFVQSKRLFSGMA
jgi:hypothetical protein